MAADYIVEVGQPISVVHVTGEDFTSSPAAVSARFWARDLSGATVLGGPATIVDPATGTLQYDGIVPTVPGELLCRFTVTYDDSSTKSFPFPGAITIEVREPNPTRPIYAGIGDLEQALGRPITPEERGHALYLLSAATVAIYEYCCQTFDPVPDPVRLACAGMAAASFGASATSGGSGQPVVQETIGDYSVRYADPTGAGGSASTTPSVYGFEFLLKSYRLCGFGSISTIAVKTDPYIQSDGDYFDILKPEGDL